MSATVANSYKNKAEKLEHLKEEIILNSKLNNQRDKNITLISSLVKFDTPFLVSSTVSNKKTLEDLEENEENAQQFLKNIIHKNNGEGELGMRDYSVRDALNKILPPKKFTEKEQIWVQYVSSTPVTKADVVTLQEGLNRKLQTQQARETGICPIREQLYNECFDELIRQVTLNCLERGILLKRIKNEIEMTVSSYQTLYESSASYGIRTLLIAEEEKEKIMQEIKDTENECEELEAKIKEVEVKIEQKKEKDKADREEKKKRHEEEILEERKKADAAKKILKDKLLSFDTK